MTTEPTEDTVSVTLTCETDGCGNQGVPITLEVPVGVTAAVCGVCGQPIPFPGPDPEPDPEPRES